MSEFWFALIVALALFGFWATHRLKRYLHIYQQEEYDSPRFWGWLRRTGAFDKMLSLILLGPVILSFAVGAEAPSWLFPLLGGLVCAAARFLEPDPSDDAAKKPLAMTQRARTILRVALVLLVLAAAPLVGLLGAIGWILAVQLAPFALMAANWLLGPLERRKQQRFWDEAQARLKKLDPEVVAITGSFGKTSVKHILNHVLDLNARSFMTPGGVNTPMGIARVIREQLPAEAEYFVVEMGAYGPGSIARLCRLTPPRMGIVTALGPAHYERFKSLDTVARAKFEIGTAALAHPEGRLVVHDSVLREAYARDFVERRRERVTLCGAEEGSDVRILSEEQTREGIVVALSWKGATYRVTAPLFGAHHAGNLAVAFGAATTLGFDPEKVATALKTAPQAKHRLEVKAMPGDWTLLDDAYNSNPNGFQAGLALLDVLVKEGGRRILITPGLVELGEKHDETHRALGAAARGRTDLVMLVKSERFPSFRDGFRAAEGEGDLLEFPTYAEADAHLRKIVRPGDVVLIENDLPDLYEREFMV